MTVLDGVLPERDAIVLQADEFELLEDSSEVRDTAERILVPINAILYLEDPTRTPLALTSVHRRAENGGWSIAIFPQSATLRLRGMRARGQVGSFDVPRRTPQSIWAETGLDDEVVADVLSYLRGTPDWIALYKAVEVMKRDVESRKSEKGAVSDWPSSEKIKAFSRAAQLHRHSKTWCEIHGITTSSAAMKFDHAAELVRSMVKAWIEWRM